MENYSLIFTVLKLSEQCNRTSIKDSSYRFYLRYKSDKRHHGIFDFCKELTTPEKVTGCFCFKTYRTHAVFELLTKFGFIKLTELQPEALQVIQHLLGHVSKITIFGSKEIKFFNIDLNCLIDLASRMVLYDLFHSLTQKGKKECIKLLALYENSCKLFIICRSGCGNLELDLKLTYL